MLQERMRTCPSSLGGTRTVPALRRPPPRAVRAAAGGPQDPKGSASSGNSIDWGSTAFPSYLQNKNEDRTFPCSEGPRITSADGTRTVWKQEDLIWQKLREEARADAASEPLLSSFLYASILGHDSFEKAIAFVLANRLANTTLLPTQLFEIFVEVLSNDDDVRCGALADVEAIRERDPSCLSMVQALLYYKGYHAIQAQRIAHSLWLRGQRVMALALQSRVSEVFAVDIHPAARIGKGILLDHGTGVVIGETAVIGDNCSLLQNITLGGTGKETGDRHPKIGSNVLIGANATVLGNIQVGDGAQIAAGSLVLKTVRPRTMVAGSPAKEVGEVRGNPAQTMDHSRLNAVSSDSYSLRNGNGNHVAAAASPPPPPAPAAAVLSSPSVSSVTASMIEGISSSAPLPSDAEVHAARDAAAAATKKPATAPAVAPSSNGSQPVSRPLRGTNPRGPSTVTPSLLDRVQPSEPLRPGEGI